MQRPSAQQMQVQMENSLASARAHVVDRAVSILDVALARDLRGDELAVADELGIFRLGLLQVHNMPLGNDEDMSRRLRVDVLEGKGALVFVDLLAWYFALNDLAEQAVTHSSPTLSRRRRRIKVEMIIRGKKRSALKQALSIQHSSLYEPAMGAPRCLGAEC